MNPATESGDRDAFLGRLRLRLANGVPESSLRPYEPIEGPAPPIRYAVDLRDLRASFAVALEAVGGRYRRVRRAEVEALLKEVCETVGVRTAAVSADPECEGVPEALRALGVGVVDRADRRALAGADLGVTGAAYGVALTGSVAVDSARAGGRAVSLLPRAHLALLPEERLLATPGDLFRGLGRTAGLPSNLVLVTGPSRSADIELQITLGVHGPGVVWVALLERERDDQG